MFTHGHWINNRSLFPSQDVPVAMATWQATIHVPQETVALMSGDEESTINPKEKGKCATLKAPKTKIVEIANCINLNDLHYLPSSL